MAAKKPATPKLPTTPVIDDAPVIDNAPVPATTDVTDNAPVPKKLNVVHTKSGNKFEVSDAYYKRNKSVLTRI